MARKILIDTDPGVDDTLVLPGILDASDEKGVGNFARPSGQRPATGGRQGWNEWASPLR